jgi:hypothetical protein
MPAMSASQRRSSGSATVSLCGFGKIAQQFVARAARLYPDTHFRVVSRRPQERDFPANVVCTDYGALAQDKGPIFLCLAVNEREILEEEYRKGVTEVPRTIVARPNSLALESVLVAEHWKERLVFVLTNPVEIICEFLFRRTGNPHIYGIGMSTDKDRLLAALAHGFGVDAGAYEKLEVTGLHFSRPIPALSAHPELLETIKATARRDVVERLTHFNSEYSVQPEKAPEFLRQIQGRSPRAEAGDCYELVHSVASAITLTEFEQNRPPTRRTVFNLLKLLRAVREQGTIELSGRRRHGSGERFLGGVFDLRSLAFQVPELDAVERRLLDRELASHEHFFTRDAMLA